MKQIADTNLNDLINGAAQALLAERRQDATSRIKQVLIRQEAMAEAIKAKELELKKLNDKMAKSTAKIERLRNGDWSVLAEFETEDK